MNRKNFITSLLVGASSGAFLASCANEKSNNNKTENTEAMQTESKTAENKDSLNAGLIIHSVYFWLKEGITAEEDKDFLNFFEELKKVPTARTLKVGKPAPTHPRPVVDNSYSYLLLVTFDTMDDINTYETHPIHLEAIEKYSKYWTKVEVKDAILL